MGAPLPPGPGHLTTCSLAAPTVVPIPGYLLSFDWPFLLSRLVSFPNSLLHVSGPAMALRGHVPVLPDWSFREATPGLSSGHSGWALQANTALCEAIDTPDTHK